YIGTDNGFKSMIMEVLSPPSVKSPFPGKRFKDTPSLAPQKGVVLPFPSLRDYLPVHPITTNCQKRAKYQMITTKAQELDNELGRLLQYLPSDFAHRIEEVVQRRDHLRNEIGEDLKTELESVTKANEDLQSAASR
ncbi:hypothetical protein PMAYCL1PPCAC_26951, partial [Pristionchus mayeri]